MALASLALLAACGGQVQRARPVAGGEIELGRAALQRYGCVSCHVVPGVPHFDSYVGPPLDRYARRGFIAGTAENTAENLVLWIQNPQAIRPGSAMPAVGVTKADARHIAAYLYSLE
jgi:cytochrome c